MEKWGRKCTLLVVSFTKEMLMARHCAFHIGRAGGTCQKELWWIRLDRSKCFCLNMKEGCQWWSGIPSTPDYGLSPRSYTSFGYSHGNGQPPRRLKIGRFLGRWPGTGIRDQENPFPPFSRPWEILYSHHGRRLCNRAAFPLFLGEDTRAL